DSFAAARSSHTSLAVLSLVVRGSSSFVVLLTCLAFPTLRPEAKRYILLFSSPLQFMANLFELPRYIAVEGPIRVGKSTLARVLAERLNAQRVMEAEDNAFLHAFYEGERGAGFQAQFAFLIRRFE